MINKLAWNTCRNHAPGKTLDDHEETALAVERYRLVRLRRSVNKINGNHFGLGVLSEYYSFQ